MNVTASRNGSFISEIAVRLTTDTHIGLIAKIKRYPTASFFVIAFLISWTAWYSAPLIAPRGTPFFSFINLVAGFGPALSAILVSAFLDSRPSNASVNKRRFTFIAVFGVALALQLLAAPILGNSFDYQTVLVFTLTSVVVAYVISCVYHPKRGVVDLMAGLRKVSGRSVWVWLALLLPFVWQTIGALVDWGLGGTELFSLTANGLVLLIAGYPLILLFGGALNEEPGWRGFAVPRMQLRFSPLVAGLLIGIVWSMWHFPLQVTGFYGNDFVGFLFRFVFNVPLGVLFSWLYNRSGGNLFACMLLHASYNSASTIFGTDSSLISIMLMIAFTIIVVLRDKLFRKSAAPTEQTARSSMTANNDKVI